MTDSAAQRAAGGFPERIGRYEVLLPIASGGMATVYLASVRGAMGFEAEVALKLTHPHLRESAEFAADTLEEAKLAARIRHRNVAAVIDADVDPAGVYLVMEYVEGDTLAGLMKGTRPLPRRMAIRVLLDALAGLHAAHELRDDKGNPLGLVHRDFTPHNVLVGLDGVARLTDFGIAKAATRLSHTRTGYVKGKVGYMAPEQAIGAPVDRRCDVWAAGVIAWELLAGRRLYTAEEDMAVLFKVATSTPPRLQSIDPSIHAEVDEAVASALTRGVEARCPTALELAHRLGDACRAHGGVADPEEVAQWVAFMCGPKLAVRREDLSRVKESRMQGRPAGDAPLAPPSPPLPPAPSQPATRRDVPAPRTLLTPTLVLGHGQAAPNGPKDEEPTRTDTASVVTHTATATPLRLRAYAFGASVLLLLVFGLLVSWRVSSLPPRPSAAATAPLPSSSLAAPGPSPSATGSTSMAADTPWTPVVPVEALPETPADSVVPSAPPPKARGARPHPPPAPRPRPAPANPDQPPPLAPAY